MKKITIIGTGYVGLISGLCFAKQGHKVICMDVDEQKINFLKEGKVPIYEPGASELLAQNIANGNIEFTTDKKKAVNDSEFIFIAVGTPQNENGDANLMYVKEAAKFIGEYISDYKVIVNKSTVPVGTADMVKETIQKELAKRREKIEFDVVSNPEFLAEGTAIADFNSERVVIGSNSKKAKQKMIELYTENSPTKNIFATDTRSAEIIKYANNSMLALRLSFINEVSQLCEKVGANIDDVSYGIGLDPRIGSKFLKAGLGYGGSCFPKDIRAFTSTAKKYKCKIEIIDKIEKVNKLQLERTLAKAKTLTGNLKGKRVCVLGLSFKPNTDDIRESPGIKITKLLEDEGAILALYDPKAMDNARKVFPNAEFAPDAYSAIKDSELIVIATEWSEFKELNKEKIKELMKKPNVLDGRNLFDPNEMKEKGFNYLSIGR
jgi:UDPglucose 6-dehydrogenase